jgi:hypothetical protein
VAPFRREEPGARPPSPPAKGKQQGSRGKQVGGLPTWACLSDDATQSHPGRPGRGQINLQCCVASMRNEG